MAWDLSKGTKTQRLKVIKSFPRNFTTFQKKISNPVIGIQKYLSPNIMKSQWLLVCGYCWENNKTNKQDPHYDESMPEAEPELKEMLMFTRVFKINISVSLMFVEIRHYPAGYCSNASLPAVQLLQSCKDSKLPSLQGCKLQRPKTFRVQCCKVSRGPWNPAARWSLMPTQRHQHVTTTHLRLRGWGEK